MNRKVKKAFKKTNKGILLCIIIFLILGIIIGFGSLHFISRNDTFELIGNKTITLNINEEYKENGVKIIEFGKNLKDKVEIESNLDTTKEGQYTIIYTIKSFRYKNIKRVRYVNVVNGSDQDE